MADDRVDPWMQGPFPATPVRPLVREYGTARDVPEPPKEVGIFQRVGQLLPHGTRHPKADEFRRLMQSSGYAAEFTEYCLRGVLAGFLRGCEAWIGDLQNDIQMYLGEPIALGMVLGSELVRGLTEENPKGLSKETREVIQASQLLAPLKLLALLTAKNSASGIIEEVGFIAEDVALALQRAGREWVDEFFAANGNARKQGFAAGEFYGRAELEVIRFVIEALVDPMDLLP